MTDDADGLAFLSETDMKKYRLQRRIAGPMYATASVEKYGGKIDAVISRFMLRLESLQGQNLDLEQWLHIFVLDALANVTLSEDLKYIEAGNDDGNLEASLRTWRMFSLVGLFPWITSLMQGFPLLDRSICGIFGVPSRQSPSVFKWAANQIQTRSRDKSEKLDMLAEILRLHVEKPEWKSSYAFGMAMTNFGAGHDTMTASLTAIVTCVCQDAKHVARIREEIASAKLNGTSQDQEVANFPYLRACMKEAMRLFPIIGQSLSRVVPVAEVTIDGHNLHLGTIVGVNPYVLNSQKSTFGDDAGVFRPERWLEAEEETTRLMDRDMVIWGGPSRSCPGQHLATLIMTKLLVALMHEFDIQLFMDDRVELQAHFLTHLEGVIASFRTRSMES